MHSRTETTALDEPQVTLPAAFSGRTARRQAGQLLVKDTRTERTYEIPIQNNAVRATDFARIKTQETTTATANDVDKGLRIIDPGFRNTAVMQSSITKLDGESGTIQYRNFKIEDLFEHCDYEDVAFLLNWGDLPEPQEKEAFRASLAQAMVPPKEVLSVVKAFPPSAPDFTIITAAMSAWNGAQQQYIPRSRGVNLYISKNTKIIDEGTIRALAAMATCTALAACHMQGKPFTMPDPKGSFPYNLLLMCNLVNARTGKPTEEHVRLFGKVMILYADHEMTNSTAAFLHVASSLADPFSCAIAGLASAHGPLHGGAIDMAYKQFAAIGSAKNVPAFLQRVRNKETRIFGFGHRIWRDVDPRYKLGRQIMESEALRDIIKSNKLLSVALEIDRQASKEEYFVKNCIRPNVDLIGCFIFNALGYEPDLVISIASVARMAGVVAHWKEQLQQPVAIWRPQAIFVEESEVERRRRARKVATFAGPAEPIKARLTQSAMALTSNLKSTAELTVGVIGLMYLM